MSNQSYKQKNNEDFEVNTQTIEKALQEIERNRNLKPTISQLAKMTRIHRNTLYNRVLPAQRLKQIKEARKIEKKSKENENITNKINPIALLEEKISNLQNETIYWFNQYQDLKLSHEQIQKKYTQIKEAQEYYRALAESNEDSSKAKDEQSQKSEILLEPFYVPTTELKQ